MCALFSYFHWLPMVAILQLKASKHFVYFVSIAVVTFTLLNISLTKDAYLTLRAKRNLCKSFYRKLPRQHKLREGRWRMESHLRDGDSQ